MFASYSLELLVLSIKATIRLRKNLPIAELLLKLNEGTVMK